MVTYVVWSPSATCLSVHSSLVLIKNGEDPHTIPTPPRGHVSNKLECLKFRNKTAGAVAVMEEDKAGHGYYVAERVWG